MGQATPAKTTRNENLYKKKIGNPKMTFPNLARIFQITEQRAKQIYYRELRKNGLKPRKYKGR